MNRDIKFGIFISLFIVLACIGVFLRFLSPFVNIGYMDGIGHLLLITFGFGGLILGAVWNYNSKNTNNKK